MVASCSAEKPCHLRFRAHAEPSKSLANIPYCRGSWGRRTLAVKILDHLMRPERIQHTCWSVIRYVLAPQIFLPCSCSIRVSIKVLTRTGCMVGQPATWFLPGSYSAYITLPRRHTRKRQSFHYHETLPVCQDYRVINRGITRGKWNSWVLYAVPNRGSRYHRTSSLPCTTFLSLQHMRMTKPFWDDPLMM